MKHVKLSPPYDSPREAYQHLLKYDAAPTLPKEAPNAPVVLFVRNDFINFRAYESFEAIQRFMVNSCVFQDNVIVSLDHLRESFRELQARKIYRLITGTRFEKDDPRDVYAVVWELFQNARPVVRMKAVNNSRQGNAYLFDLQLVSTFDKKVPKQCSVIMKALVGEQRSSYTLDELKIFANKLEKYGLATKSKPFTILQYYLPQLHGYGLVEYPRKTYEKEEGAGDE